MSDSNYRNWKTERGEHNIAWLFVDKADSHTNVLSADVIEELGALINEIAADPPSALIIASAKTSGFIAGADVNEFTRFTDSEAALTAIRRTHEVFDALEALPCPTVAMINGYCLGGGLELALACRYRIATDDPSTRLGLPEVRLGIHPGFGGTYRMIRTVGAPAGLDAILTGRSLSARAAKRMALVDYAVPERHLRTAAVSVALKPPTKKPLAWWKRLASYRLLRPALSAYLSRKVAVKAPKAHYPAPYAVLDLWVRYYDEPKRLLDEEAASEARLIVGKTAQNLVRVFLLQEQLKSLAKASDFTVHHVHVIGGGVMGGDIAAWCAVQGFSVTLQDRQHDTLARAYKRANGLFGKRLKDRRLAQHARDRFAPDLDGDGIKRADVIIEAIFEDVEAKRSLFQDVEPQMKPDAILATNTSSIPLEELATVLQRPERLVGLHFFNPVAKMPLVEIVHGKQTNAGTVQDAASFTKAIGRLPLPVTSTPGFLVNRILMPYLIEAVTLLEEGVPPVLIDKAAVDFGMPMGPIELADTVGLDICFHVAKILSKNMDIAVPDRLSELVDRKQLGKKTGYGFYKFKSGKPVKPDVEKGYTAPADLQDRLILRLLNEAVGCLHDGVVETADQLDAGVVFGTGFAPFRGGPINYIMNRGVEQLSQTLQNLQKKHGDRFASNPGWQDLKNKELGK